MPFGFKKIAVNFQFQGWNKALLVLEKFFHYRNVDVSTIKELCRRWKPELINGFKKHQMHTALADILESVEELRYYREHFIKL